MKHFGPNELGGTDEGNARSEHVRLSCVIHPVVGDLDRARRRGENDVEVMYAFVDLREPDLIFDGTS
jgi:hypothetical protein